MSTRKSKNLLPAGVSPRAAIYLLNNEFLLVADRDGRVEQKYVSPGAVRAAFAAEPIDSGWIPEGVRRWGVSSKGTFMLRWHAPAIYPVWLNERKRQVKVPMPGLVFFAQGGSYYLWAMKNDKFDPKAQLWNAPCANVNELGLICWGTNPHPDVATGCFDKQWATFWEAPFSGSWAGGKSREFPGDANKRLATLAGVEKYPEEDLEPVAHRLLPRPATLEAAVELFTRRGENQWE